MVRSGTCDQDPWLWHPVQHSVKWLSTFYHSFHHQALEPPNGPFCPQPTYTGCVERSPPSVFHFCTPFCLIKLVFYFHLFLSPLLWFHHSHPSVLMRSGSKCLCIRHSYSFCLSLFLYTSPWMVSVLLMMQDFIVCDEHGSTSQDN